MTENQLSTAAPVGGETEHQPQPHEAPGQPGTSETASRPVDPPSTADTESDSADVPRSSAEQAYTDSRFQPMNPRMAELPLGGPFAQQPDSSVLQTADKNEDHTPSDHAKVSRPANELSDVERHSKGTKRQLEELRENMQRQLVSRAQIPAPSSSRQATRNPRHVDLMEDVFSASQRQQEEPSNSPSPVSPYNEDVLERNMIMSLLDIVHRFLDAIQDAQEIFEENDAAHYASYERLRKKHETIQNFWRCFVAESTITFTRRSLDELQLLCNDIEHVYTNMVTPRPASSRYANIMADCRARAKWVAEEARALQQILAEYIVAKEEIGVPRAPGPNDSEPKVSTVSLLFVSTV